MATFLDVITAIQGRVGYTSSEYLARIKRAINWAQGEVCEVNWKFLLRKDNTTVAVLAGDVIYDLPASFSRFESLYLEESAGVQRQLIEAHEDDIWIAPANVAGTPAFYSHYGRSATSPYRAQVVIGAPTANAGHTVTLNYYIKPSDLVNDADTSPIQDVYRDEPLISGGLYKFHKDLDEHDLAQDALRDFLMDMAAMERVMPFNGPTYKEILAQREL